MMGSWRYGPLLHWVDNNRAGVRQVDPRVPDEEYLLTYIEQGQAWFVDGDQREKITLPAVVLQVPGRGPKILVPAASTFLRLAFDVVRVACHRGGRRRLIHNRSCIQPPPEEIWGIEVPPIVPEPLRESCLAMCSYCAAQWWRGDLEFMNANARLTQWLANLITHLARKHPEGDTSWLGRSQEALSRCVDQPTRIEQVAKIMGMSRSHFTSRFKAQAGQTPHEFLRGLRMEEACRLLTTTNHPIRKIAELCGSRSTPTFSNEFPKRFGLSPGQWRRTQQLSTNA